VCQITAELPVVGLSALGDRRRGVQYQLDARGGPLRFDVDYLGLVKGRGEVHRFTGALHLVGNALALSGLDLAIGSEDVSLTWLDTLPGMQPDAPRAQVRFQSSAIETAGLRHWHLRGLLEIDGTARLQSADVSLTDRFVDAITGTEVAVFDLAGSLSSDVYGLAHPSATFTLALRIQVELDQRG
jgi:polyisoprenoid-binding protein YceI